MTLKEQYVGYAMIKEDVDHMMVEAFDKFKDEHPEFANAADEMSFYYDPDDNCYVVSLSCAMYVDDFVIKDKIFPSIMNGFVKIFEHMKNLFVNV